MNNYKTCKTVGELIDYLKTFDPNLQILKEEHHMETGSSLKSPVIHKTQYIETQKHCRDSFDGTNYTTTLKIVNYDENKKGIDCLIL